jgi:hypothetical protein
MVSIAVAARCLSLPWNGAISSPMKKLVVTIPQTTLLSSVAPAVPNNKGTK